jgi:hypothetical protein
MTNDCANAYQTKALYSLSLSHTHNDAQMRTTHTHRHTQHITHSFYYQWFFTQMRTPNKSSTLSIATLSLSYTWDDAQMRTTHNILHIPSMTNDLRKCAPNKSSTLFYFSNSHTHDVIYFYANAYHTQNITHTVYSVSRLCSLSCAYTHIEYFHVYMLIRICVREGLQGRTRDFRLREKKMVPEILYLDWADYCHNGVHVYKVLWWVDSQK